MTSHKSSKTILLKKHFSTVKIYAALLRIKYNDTHRVRLKKRWQKRSRVRCSHCTERPGHPFLSPSRTGGMFSQRCAFDSLATLCCQERQINFSTHFLTQCNQKRVVTITARDQSVLGPSIRRAVPLNAKVSWTGLGLQFFKQWNVTLLGGSTLKEYTDLMN